jgi:hypothetical protein
VQRYQVLVPLRHSCTKFTAIVIFSTKSKFSTLEWLYRVPGYRYSTVVNRTKFSSTTTKSTKLSTKLSSTTTKFTKFSSTTTKFSTSFTSSRLQYTSLNTVDYNIPLSLSLPVYMYPGAAVDSLPGEIIRCLDLRMILYSCTGTCTCGSTIGRASTPKCSTSSSTILQGIKVPICDRLF